jgi:hypothetical protein
MVLGLPGSAEPRFKPLDAQQSEWLDRLAVQIETERMRLAVESLPAPRNRLHSPEAMLQTEALILDGFRQSGWQAWRRPFTLTNVRGYPDEGNDLEGFMRPVIFPRLEGANLLAIKEGESSRAALVVMAHFDTVRDTPGADDNSASVIALLELARLLESYRFRHSLILAATDMEELDLFGARELAKTLAKERRVLGAVSMETLAYYCHQPGTQFLPPGIGALFPGQVRRIASGGFRGDFTLLIYSGAASQLSAAYAAGLEHLAGLGAAIQMRNPLDLPVVGRLLRRLYPAARNFGRSDHAAFWELGLPGMMVTDTANFRNPHYHQPTDTPEKLDYGRLAAVTGACAFALAEVGGMIV